MDNKFLKPFSPKETEKRIYEKWEKSGFFNPDICVERGIIPSDAKSFTVIMPPPNVTGVLHMGHALMLTLEDIMVRYKRMRGLKTLWLPGTDHAAIATQTKVEKGIYKKEGKTRHNLGREVFLSKVEQFAKESHDTIVSQIKTMGASCDWKREAYTLDEKRNQAVKTVFKKMYDDGLIYRGFRVVNWDPKGQTTVSDDEVEHTETKGKLYTFRYSKDFPISIATTRPETKLGDVAVAVHPDDARYKEYVGQTFNVNFVGTPLSIRVIADETVDPQFGTGAVGITPAHSMTDWEIAERHKLPMLQVINEYAKITTEGEFQNKKTLEARAMIVDKLRQEGLLEKEEDNTLNLSTAQRSGGTIEPLPKLQWFIDVNKEFTIPESRIPGIASGSKTTLKKIMRTAVESGAIKIIPDYFDKTYFHWIDNLGDWCISRQIWFGHRIPVWYRKEEIFCGMEAPKGEGWEQDPDTLDTWFSSSLWTFSTLGWPDKTEDLKIYHPTDVLETGYEILFFWVARMILMTGYVLGDIPFHTIYLHGTVRDSQGRKMSKSLGNGIDPIDIAEKFGSDAGRMTLIVGNTPGTDMRISEEKIKGYKHFANKMWNVARFVHENTKDTDSAENIELEQGDKDTLADFEKMTRDITADMESFRFYLAAEKLYHYLWHQFADIVIESSKARLREGNDKEKNSTKRMLRSILGTSLVLLHPFMPFVTEEIWECLGNKDILMVRRWPVM
ncbi:MAG: valine--tRNA ligase [bacterium]|nr:valine--tRNA ligase [bacterium]